MKKLMAIALLMAFSLTAHADLSLPKKQNFYDKVGRGAANIIGAPAELLDSIFYYNEVEGGTVALTKGVAQGTGRMVSDMAHGAFDLITAPFPVGPYFSYQSWKARPYNSMVVNEYPPSDLINWW